MARDRSTFVNINSQIRQRLLPEGAMSRDFELNSSKVKMFVCAHSGCGVNFRQYAGMRVIAPGIGLCLEHNRPKTKEPKDERQSPV